MKIEVVLSALHRAMSLSLNKLKKKPPSEVLKKPKKIDRFDGLTEEEVQKYTLPDILDVNLDMVFVGINPSLMAAHRGRYYAGPGNHFYKLLHESGLTPRFVSFEEDYKLPQYGIGLTNIVHRATRSSADLKRSEIKEGATIVEEKLKIFKPKIAIFNGKGIYEVYANKTSKSTFNFGLQSERVGDTVIWVVPSSSARCANFPRMVDKLHFYVALKKYLLYLKGKIEVVDAKEFLFEGKCKQFIPRTSKMWRRKNVSAFVHGGRIANKETVSLDTSEDNIAHVGSTEFIIVDLKSETNVEKINDEPNNEARRRVSSEEENARTSEKIKLEGFEETYCNKSTPDERKVISRKEDDCDVLGCSSTVLVCRKNGEIRKRNEEISSKLVRASKRVKDNDDTSDFITLIKRRLLEKKNKEEENFTVSEENSMVPCGMNGVKRLKYSNLKSNCRNSEFSLSSGAGEV